MDWVSFFDENNVQYVTRGPNTKRGEVSIPCPFCGEDDPSEHMGVSLSTDNWGCLRDSTHRGKQPYRLIQALLGCSYTVARTVVTQYSEADPAAFDALSPIDVISELHSDLMNTREAPPDWRPIRSKGSTAKFWRYLIARGFPDPAPVVAKYHLSCCLNGYWKDRLYFRYYCDGKLRAWQGRALSNPVMAPRYLSSKTLKHTVFNEEELMKGGHTLFVTEGPFDAMTMDWWMHLQGVRATCTFGVTPSTEQIQVLALLRKQFERVKILFDQDAFGQAVQLSEWIQNTEVIQLPEQFKDPAEMPPEAIDKLARL